MNRILSAFFIIALIAGNVWSQSLGSGGGGGTGTFPPSGCATANGVIFNNATPCDSGFTYSGTANGVVLVPDGSAGSSVGVPGIAFTNASQIGFRRSATNQIIFTSAAADIWGSGASNITMRNNGLYGFSASAAVTGGVDSNISRNAAGVLSFGTSAANGLGTAMAALFAPGLLYSAAGTPLPACAAGTNGYTAIVSDNTAPTYRSAYTSGGAVVTRMICVSGTGWLSD